MVMLSASCRNIGLMTLLIEKFSLKGGLTLSTTDWTVK